MGIYRVALLGGLWIPVLVLAMTAIGPAPLAAQGDPSEESTIFRRFGTGRVAPENWQFMPEFPVFLRPQADPDAKIVRNDGANLIVSFRPRNRIYFSRGYGFAQVSWKPKGGSVKKVEVTSFDISQLLNFSIKRTFIVTFGLGLGLMDAVIHERKGSIRNRLEPFVPFHFGLGIDTGTAINIAFKVSQHIFLGPGPVVSLTRGLVGIGINF